MVFPGGYNGGKMNSQRRKGVEGGFSSLRCDVGNTPHPNPLLRTPVRSSWHLVQLGSPPKGRGDRNCKAATESARPDSSHSPGFCMKHAILPNEPTDFVLENSSYPTGVQWVTQ